MLASESAILFQIKIPLSSQGEKEGEGERERERLDIVELN
jgi:hypothetical protein